MEAIEFSHSRSRVMDALNASRVVVVLNTKHVKDARHLVDTMSAVYRAGFVPAVMLTIDPDIIRDAMPDLRKMREARN